MRRYRLLAQRNATCFTATRISEENQIQISEENSDNGRAAGAGAVSTVDAVVHVNGRQHRLTIDPRSSLLDLLRESLGLNGAKKGCDHGQCGACTVHVDGKRVVSCLLPAVTLNGREVSTIEHFSSSFEELHPMQRAFIDNDALQCGYCTPGQIMSAIACVREGHATTTEDIREYMSGNLCRCGAYVGIVQAIKDAAEQTQEQ